MKSTLFLGLLLAGAVSPVWAAPGEILADAYQDWVIYGSDRHVVGSTSPALLPQTGANGWWYGAAVGEGFTDRGSSNRVFLNGRPDTANYPYVSTPYDAITNPRGFKALENFQRSYSGNVYLRDGDGEWTIDRGANPVLPAGTPAARADQANQWYGESVNIGIGTVSTTAELTRTGRDNTANFPGRRMANGETGLAWENSGDPAWPSPDGIQMRVDQSQGLWPVLRWVSTFNGQIHIDRAAEQVGLVPTGNPAEAGYESSPAFDGEPYHQDGVYLKAYKNGSLFANQWLPHRSEYTLLDAIINLTVKQGDVLDFVLANGYGSQSRFDTFRYDVSITEQIPADANDDGRVDVSDLGILAANYGQRYQGTWGTGDFNNDGKIDVSDLGILAANYEGAGMVGMAAVPEPATFLFFILAGLGFLQIRKRY